MNNHNLIRPLQIAIIGAGIAGLSCARALLKPAPLAGPILGDDRAVEIETDIETDAKTIVTIFEKSRGVAGRMSTRRGDGWQCDHGAPYFTVRSAEFQAEVARWMAARVAAPWTPPFDKNASEKGLAQFVGIPRMTSPAQWLAAPLTVHTASTVQGIQRIQVPQTKTGHAHHQWQLKTAEHGLHAVAFDRVVLAVPAPQAVALLGDVAPALSRQAEHIRMRGCWVLMMRFETAISQAAAAVFARPLIDIIATEPNDAPIAWLAPDSSKPSRNGQETWVLHATNDWSDRHLEDDVDTVTALLLAAFRQRGGPAPQACTAHRWRYASTEVCAGTSEIIDETTCVTTPDVAGQHGCAWDNELQIGLCGDWLQGGNVEGAWLSGQRLAQQILTQQLAGKPHPD